MKFRAAGENGSNINYQEEKKDVKEKKIQLMLKTFMCQGSFLCSHHVGITQTSANCLPSIEITTNKKPVNSILGDLSYVHSLSRPFPFSKLRTDDGVFSHH